MKPVSPFVHTARNRIYTMGDSEDSISPLVKSAAHASSFSPQSPLSTSSSARAVPPPLQNIGSSVFVQGLQGVAGQQGIGGQYQRHYRTRRSQSAPLISSTYGLEEPIGVEASFLKIGDRVAFYSEKESSHGFVSTLG